MKDNGLQIAIWFWSVTIAVVGIAVAYLDGGKNWFSLIAVFVGIMGWSVGVAIRSLSAKITALEQEQRRAQGGARPMP
jgi:hypothetical protein